MLARRVIAISPDKSVAKRISIALKAAGGTVETYESLGELASGKIEASLVVIHLSSANNILEQLSERLHKDGFIIPVLPSSNLDHMVAAMDTSTQVASVFVADSFTTHGLAATVNRVLFGDIFGLEKIVPWGTRIYSTLVGDYQEKSLAIAQISEFAATMGVRRKYRDAIESAADEMLMNALYDAPVDSKGKSIFADVPTKTRISLRMEQKAVVQYSCDGDSFLMSVRDSFGTLDRDTVLFYLNKCLHSDQQIDRKTGGAGLGLYIMANASTEYLFNVLPGVATECVCKLNIKSPGIQLQNIAFYHEKIDAAGRLVGGASKLLPTNFPVERRRAQPDQAPRAVIYGLAGAIVLLLALIGMIGIPRLIATPTSKVRISTTPKATNIEINGNPRGVTTDGSLLLENLEVGRAYRLRASQTGWKPAETVFEPVKGKAIEVALNLRPVAVGVQLVSDPPGATVLYHDKPLGTTPFRTTNLPPSTQVELLFRKIGYKDTKRTVKLPSAGSEVLLSPTLAMSPKFGSVQITSEPKNAQVYQNGELIAGLVTPVDELVIQSRKQYKFTLKLPGHMPEHFLAKVGRAETKLPIHRKLSPGGGLTIRSNYDARITVEKAKHCNQQSPLVDCPLKNGTYKVRLVNRRLLLRRSFSVKIEGNDVSRKLSFGMVEAMPGFRFSRFGRMAKQAAFETGTHSVRVVSDLGKEQTVNVRVLTGRRVFVPTKK